MVATSKFLNDDIVISGMSGRFPECDTIDEFREKLLSGVDMIKDNDSRWPKGYLNTYSKMGFIKDLRNFDASFFGAHPKLAERTDPIVRVLLETSVEAVMDAGICPSKIRGTETGVVACVSSNEAADWWSADPDRVNGYEFLGCTRTMYSNRISFAMDLKGPSYTLDSQASSGLLGIEQAYYMLKTGMTDAVIVAGVNLILNPHFNIMFKKLGMLSSDGKGKVFDADSNGYVRSEAGVAILLQRASDAKRIYATVAGTGSCCDGYKPFGCNTVSENSQISLYNETLRKFNINPLDIAYVETHGFAEKESDAMELNGICKVYGGDREKPLLIGSVKSNIGNGEPVQGLVSIVKILIAMETGLLAPNLHFKTPNPLSPALKDGRLQVVDKLTIWNGKFAAINAFGIGGTNSHLILKRHEKEKLPVKRSTIPRIVTVSGRTEKNVETLLKRVSNHQADNEFCSLLADVFSHHIPHFNHRGFAIYDAADTFIEQAAYTPRDIARPVCYVFSGMGSQWSGMCKELLALDVFKQSIDQCAAVLKTVNFNLIDLLNSKDKHVFDNVLNSFVGITCIQISLVNVLHEIGIKPDFIVGHSVGELACAYADETLTLQQTVLTTYWRGKTLLQTEIPVGAMAAIGLSSSDVGKRLPKDIFIACHNSDDSVTISGPPKSIEEFTKQLTAEGIFAREVNSSGYAFHSEYIAKAGPAFKMTLEKIIPTPKLRTKRWISTSVPEHLWNTQSAKYSSVAYHLNNLLSPVYFNKALTHIPENAVVIEIAPHALLQSILKGCLSSSCSHIGLVRRNQASVSNLLSSLGRLYNAGLQPNFTVLYPKVSYPVSRTTPMIQSLMEWDHSVKWFLISFMTKPACVRGEVESWVDITENMDKYQFLNHCIVDNVPTFPVSGYLYLIWEAVAKFQVKFLPDVPVVIENFQVLRKSLLSREKPLRFQINILEKSNECEIREDGVPVARAHVYVPENADNEFSQYLGPSNEYDGNLTLRSSDIYLDLFEKGYLYTDEFQVIKYTDNKGEKGSIKWSDNWITYIEGLLQLHLQRIPKQSFYTINHIQKVIIDPRKHLSMINKLNSETESKPSGVPVSVYPQLDIISSGGIELRGIKSTLTSVRNKQPETLIKEYTFVPHLSGMVMTLDGAIDVCAQIVAENCSVSGPLTTAVVTNLPEESIAQKIKNSLSDEPYVNCELTLLSNKTPPEELVNDLNASVQLIDVSIKAPKYKYYLLVVSNILSDNSAFKNSVNSVSEDGFMMVVEDKEVSVSDEDLDNLNCKLIAKFKTNAGAFIVLLRKTPVWKTALSFNVKKDSINFVDSIKMALRKHHIDNRNTMVLFHGNEPTGILGLLKSVRREPYGSGMICLFTDDSIHPYKIVDLEYIAYLRKGLVFNVHKNGEWGSYRLLPVQDQLVNAEHAFVGLTEIGNFSTLKYIEGRIPQINSTAFENYKLCFVYYTAMYPHRDNLLAVGGLPLDESVVDILTQMNLYGDINEHSFLVPRPNMYTNHKICSVYYSSIYAHDIRSASGSLPYDDAFNIIKQGSVLGHEYCGRLADGKRVFGMVGGGSLATTVLADCDVMWNVPDNWTMEQAVTVPRVYSVAYYALISRAQLQPNESVYINAGFIGLAVASLYVALGVKAIPYIGYNNQTERNYFAELFPKLPGSTFINLEECSFEYQLLKLTSGNGVDVIFDITNSHKRNMFIDALAYNGRLVEFEKGTAFNDSLGYAALEKNIVFHKVSHNTLWVKDAGKEDRIRIQKMVTEGVLKGVVKPLPATIFTDQQLEEAFRVTQSGKYKGKVVIKIRDEEPTKVIAPKSKIVKALPSAFLSPDHSYIVTTAFSEQGVQIVNWLLNRGAKKLVLHSTYQPVTGYQCLSLRRWKNTGVEIVFSNADISTSSGANLLIDAANKLGDLGGVFHVAYITCDCSFDQSSKNHFELLWKAKVETTKNLDLATRTSKNLKYFVGFSDVCSSFGSVKKSMLAFSCSAMEMIFEERKNHNLPATVIQVGLLEKLNRDLAKVDEYGLVPVQFSNIVNKLPQLLAQKSTILTVYARTPSPANLILSKELSPVNSVADILGVRSIDKLYTTTFGEIGSDPQALDRINEVLKSKGISMDTSDVKGLSFEKVAQLLMHS